MTFCSAIRIFKVNLQHVKCAFVVTIIIFPMLFARASQESGGQEPQLHRWTIDDCFLGNANYDVVFSVDVVVGKNSIRDVQLLLNDVTRRINHTMSGARVSLMTFAGFPRYTAQKRKWKTQAEWRRATARLKPLARKKRNIGKSLLAISQSIMPKSGRRTIVVLIVGGKSTDSVLQAAKLLHKKSSHVIVIGYHDVDLRQLRVISSKPSKENFFKFETSSEIGMATESIMSIVCEQNLNTKTSLRSKFMLKKRISAKRNKKFLLLGQRTITSLPNSIRVKWIGGGKSLMNNYKVFWVPNDGDIEMLTNESDCLLLLRKLEPATIYRIKIIPIVKTSFRRAQTLIVATAPLPVEDLRAEIQIVQPCSLQKQLLQNMHRATVGVLLKPEDCKKNKTIVVVNWKKTSNVKFFMTKIEPKSARLVRVPRDLPEQFLTNLKSGTNYTISVVSRGPKLHSSPPVETTVVIPPEDPNRLDVAIINSTTVAIRWQVPRDTKFDAFIAKIVSAFGKQVYNVLPPENSKDAPTSDQPRPFYHFLVPELRPETDYRVTVYTTSMNVTSLGKATKQFTTKFSTDMYNEPFLIISGGDGIYAATANRGPRVTETVQKLFAVAGGVVNSVYHNRWIQSKPQNYNPFTSESYQWQKLLIWIERRTRHIKVTDLTKQSKTSTIVAGLLQPVALQIDPYGENIYWSDIGTRTIGIATITSGLGPYPYQINRKLIAGDLESPVSLAINIVERYLFWGDLQGQIERSMMDGSHRTILFRKKSMQPYSMTYCIVEKRLFWIDAATGNLESITNSGTNHLVVLEKSVEPMMTTSSLVKAGGNIFWYDVLQSSVFKVEKINGSDVRLPVSLYPNSDVPLVTAMSSFDPVGLEKAMGFGDFYQVVTVSLMRPSIDLSFPCSPGHTLCIGVCIPVTLNDAACSTDCHPWEMICYRSTETVCISKHLTCNGIMDCQHGEDEDLPECEKTLNEKMCAFENMTAYGCNDTGKCISYDQVCDGRLDCEDGSDEIQCPVHEQSCDFDSNSLCLWRQEENDDDFDWRIHHGKTLSGCTGPLMDHTMTKVNGSYVYLEATPRDEGDSAQLISVYLAKPVCISFYYFMRGRAMGTLSLLSRSYGSDDDTVLWSKTGDQGIDWRKAVISVDQHHLYQLILKGARGSDFCSDIAVDDITIMDGLCDANDHCDFSNADRILCGYDIGDLLLDFGACTCESWELTSVPLSNKGTDLLGHEIKKQILQDLSTLIGPGWFYFEFKSDDFPGCNECEGPRIVRDISSQVYSDYGVNFVGVVLCSTSRYKIFLGKTLSGSFRNIADGAGKGEDHCEFIGGKEYAVNIGDYKNCEGDHGFVRKRWGDRLSVESYGFYRSIYFTASWYECGFKFPQEVIDHDPKHWKNLLPDNYLRYNTEHLNGKIKIPVFLITTEGGNEKKHIKPESLTDPRLFAFFTSVTIPNEKNEFTITPKFSHPKSWCLEFRYYMLGEHMPSLLVSINMEHDIWIKNGNQGDSWRKASVAIPYPSIKYDITISTTGGNSIIGIDDVAILQKSCSPQQRYKCTFDIPIEEDCSFTVVGEPAKQVILQPDDSKSRFVPYMVRDFKSPQGVLTSTSIKLSNDTILTAYPILRSPLLPALSQFYPVLCLFVTYRQKARDGYISVVIRSHVTNETHTLSQHELPTKKSSIHPWLMYISQINSSVPLIQSDFFIEFHGLNATWVNELTLNTVECSAMAKDLCSTAVQCKNGKCVPPELLCDGIDDCEDWSDEIGCPSQCGTIADYYESDTVLNGTGKLESDTCTFRIHGIPGKHILLTVGKQVTLPTSSSHVKMKVYKGFQIRSDNMLSPEPGYFPPGSLLFMIESFTSRKSYFIIDNDVTIIMEYSSLAAQPIPLSYKMVEQNHCSHVCPNHHCLFDNRRCDGHPGCKDGSDEKNCTRIVHENGINIFEVQRLQGRFAPICSDDITDKLADAICKQLGNLHAERPLLMVHLPPSYAANPPHKLISKIKISDQLLLQAFIAKSSDDDKASFSGHIKKNGQQCTSNKTWVPNCISYQCGVRPIDVNIFTLNAPAMSPILRILGGARAKKGRWPWMASLLIKEHDHNCGATLVSDRYILTAAHCFDEHDPKVFTVLLGATSIRNNGPEAVKHKIKRGIIHSSYNKEADIPDWDIALLELEVPVHFSTYVSPICLPQGEMEFPPGTICYIAGYGHISEGRRSPYILHEAKTPIISNEACDSDMYRGSITERMLCAGYPKTGGVGICHGDSGGPLMCQHGGKGPWYLVGVTSWSIGCASRLKPDVFSRILSHVAWVNKETGFNLTLPKESKPIVGTCGGVYYGETLGEFASPGWPKNYESNQECTYLILADLGQTIELTFNEFATEMYFDIVEIFSGSIGLKNRLTSQLSGSRKPEHVKSRSSALYVRFTSDSDSNDRGFLAKWMITGAPVPYKGSSHPFEVKLRPGQSQNVLNYASTYLGYFFFFEIGSGGWPSYKLHKVKSDLTILMSYIPSLGYWTIAPEGRADKSGLRIACVKSVPDLCSSSWQLWNGTAWTMAELKILLQTGLVLPTTTTATTPTVVNLVTDTSTQCGDMFTNTNGTITSLDYGSKNYSNDVFCKWIINPASDFESGTARWILLEILDMDTEKDQDFLKGFSSDDISGSPLFELSGNQLQFRGIDGTSDDPEIETIEEENYGSRTTISSTSDPELRNEDGSGTDSPGKIIGLFEYEDIHSEGITLTFTSNSNTTGKGFHLRYYVMKDIKDAPFVSDSQSIVRIEIKDDADSTSRAKRSADSDSREMTYDLDSFYEFDGGSGNFTYDNYYYPDPFGTSEYLQLSLNPSCNHTLNANSSKTINISHKSMLPFDDKYCMWRIETSSSLHLINISLTLFGFNGTSDNYSFRLRGLFHDLFILDSAPTMDLCEFLPDEDSYSSPLHVFSCNVTNIFIYTTDKSWNTLDYIEIYFKSDVKNLGFNALIITTDIMNFTVSPSMVTTTIPATSTIMPTLPSLNNQEISITSNCENTIERVQSNELKITSPNFPGGYKESSNCTWVLVAPKTHEIKLEFKHFDIEDSADCGYDNLTISGGGPGTDPIGVYCGKNVPKSAFSTGSIMVVTFTSDKVFHKTGFLVVAKSSEVSRVQHNKNVLYSCDFDEEDICQFQHGKSNDVEFTWTKLYSATPSENTGPPHDASESRNGYYMFIEASMPRVPGDRARLISPVIKGFPHIPICLSFAYSMRGLSVGSLMVYISIASDGTMDISDDEKASDLTKTYFDLKPIVLNFGAGIDRGRSRSTYRNTSDNAFWQQYLLWSKTGAQSEIDPWITAQVTFIPNNHFQLLFEGIRGPEYQSDIAIDNIVVSQGACEKYECDKDREIACIGNVNGMESTACISKELECDGHRDCESGSDESKCDSELEQACKDEIPIAPNTTEWMVCKNIEKCQLPSTAKGRISDIACNGKTDCFGGYDETNCHVLNGLGHNKESSDNHLYEVCGRQLVKDRELTRRSYAHEISPDVMPWIASLHVKIDSKDFDASVMDDRDVDVFLCAAVFIQEDWLLAPAHCLLDPELTSEDLSDFLLNRGSSTSSVKVGMEKEKYVPVGNEIPNWKWNDAPWVPDLGPLSEYQDPYPEYGELDDTMDQSHSTFQYLIKTQKDNSKGKFNVFKVLKVVPHPKYSISKKFDSNCNDTQTTAQHDETEKVPHATTGNYKCDVNRINTDVALIKVQKISKKTQDSKLSESVGSKAYACVNKMDSAKNWNPVSSTNGKNSYGNIFQPPLESLSFSADSKHVKATCYVVAYSATNSTADRSLVLSRKSVQLFLGDVSTKKILCGMQNKYKTDPDCLEKIRKDSSINPLIFSGYGEIKDAFSVYDQGSVIMCQGWDSRWYLTGLRSWSNLYRNLHHERLFEAKDSEDTINGGMLRNDRLVGVPLGMDLYMDVSLINSWVQETLQNDCPGEFSCYEKTSPYFKKCISKTKLCNGIIDCPHNFLDEINCASGCSYDPLLDPFNTYYRNLNKAGVALPENIIREHNLKGSNRTLLGSFMELDEKNPKSIIITSGEYNQKLLNASNVSEDEKSWRNGRKGGKIRANKVKDQKIKMCIWTIKAPKNKVAVLHITDFNAVAGGNRIQVITNSKIGRSELLRVDMKDIHFTSMLDDTLTIRILPPPGQIYLSEIKHFEAIHDVEALEVCKGRHKCGDGSCVSPHRVCDGIWDCKDKSDESSCPSGCGGNAFISGPSSGEITSKNYPLSHSGNGDCQWQFVSKHETKRKDLPGRIKLQFLDFQTSDHDVLYIFKGAGVRKSGKDLLGVYHGKLSLFNVTIKANLATVLLRSNDYIKQRRIHIRYTVNAGPKNSS